MGCVACHKSCKDGCEDGSPCWDEVVCGDNKFRKLGQCLECTTCEGGTYISEACGGADGAQDRGCTACTDANTCGKKEYLAGYCSGETTTDDRFCAPCHESCQRGCVGPSTTDCDQITCSDHFWHKHGDNG